MPISNEYIRWLLEQQRRKPKEGEIGAIPPLAPSREPTLAERILGRAAPRITAAEAPVGGIQLPPRARPQQLLELLFGPRKEPEYLGYGGAPIPQYETIARIMQQMTQPTTVGTPLEYAAAPAGAPTPWTEWTEEETAEFLAKVAEQMGVTGAGEPPAGMVPGAPPAEPVAAYQPTTPGALPPIGGPGGEAGAAAAPDTGGMTGESAAGITGPDVGGIAGAAPSAEATAGFMGGLGLGPADTEAGISEAGLAGIGGLGAPAAGAGYGAEGGGDGGGK